jgi:magnesium-transporting ATPase (P-type)
LPNNQIYKFEGNLQLNGIQDKISLNIDYVALRGSTLRNTDHIYGVVLFAGKDTKVMMNSAKAKYKFSQLEKSTNISILIILAL